MRFCLPFGFAAAAALATAGCSPGVNGAPIAAAATPVASPAPAPATYGAFLEGPVGMKLDAADRDKALAAEQDAVASNQRRTWKGGRGTFGFVEPAATVGQPTPDGAACRAFTSTVFLSGRPQVGRGTGCPNPDGSYRIAS